MLDTHARHLVDPLLQRIARRFLSWGLRTNQVTVLAGIFGLGTAALVLLRQPWVAVAMLALSGVLDAVDGQMARFTKPTPFGTLLDVTLDRAVEGSVIVALAILFPQMQLALLVLTVGIVLAMTVFLTVGALVRVASIKSFYYQPGIAERTEGLILLSLMIVWPSQLLTITIVFIVVEYATTVQRFIEGWRLLRMAKFD